MVQAGETLQKRRVFQVAGAAAVLFVLLFGWQLFEAQQARQERDEVAAELVFQRMATDLALAVIEASYGSYESARGLTSSFFTRLQENAERGPAEGRARIQSILQRRDAVITALSRSDPESPDILARMLFQYRTAIGEPARSELAPAPGAPRGDTVEGMTGR